MLHLLIFLNLFSFCSSIPATSVISYRERVKKLIATGDSDGLAFLSQEWAKHQHRNPIPHFLLSVVYGMKGHERERFKEVRIAFEMGSAEIRRFCTDIAQELPRDCLAQSIAGEAFFFSEDYRTARGYFERANSLCKNITTLCDLGYILVHLGEIDKAAALFMRLLARHPNTWGAYLGLGSVYASRGKHEEAISCLEKAVRLNPLSSAAHHDLGVCYFNVGRFREALGELRHAVELVPDKARYWQSLGQTYYSMKNLTKAKEAYRKASELDPTYLRSYKRLQHYLYLPATTEFYRLYRTPPGQAP